MLLNIMISLLWVSLTKIASFASIYLSWPEKSV